MKKFLNVLLKVILTLSFAGIIVTVTFVIINNQSIAYEAYSHITTVRNSNNFLNLFTEVDSGMKLKYGATDDPYVKAITIGLKKVNSGIDYFLDYLSVEYDLTKGEQDNLISKYDKYADYVSITKQNVKNFAAKYNEAINSEFARTQVEVMEKEMVKDYLAFYQQGSSMFKDLVNVVNKYCYNSTKRFTFEHQKHMMKVGISDHFLQEVFYKDGNLAPQRLDMTKAQQYGRFRQFCEYDNLDIPINIIENEKFNTLVNNLNTLNIYEFAGNYINYYNSLKGDMQTKVARTNQLFEEIF